MSKFTFICEDDDVPYTGSIKTERIFKFQGVELSDIVQEFEMFLKGCGFNLNGRLDIVDEPEYAPIPSSMTGVGYVEDEPIESLNSFKHSQVY